MATNTISGGLSYRVGIFASTNLLTRALPYLNFEKFGQSIELPVNHGDTIQFRRYEALDSTPNELTEGVTPAGKPITFTPVTAQLKQYGDLVVISDVVNDTHEDPVLKVMTTVLGEQAAEMLEKVRFGILKAGTNVFFANGTQRSDVNTVITRDAQRNVVRALKRQSAKPVISAVRSTPNFGTLNVLPTYIGIVHPDCMMDIRDMTGFKPVEDYGQVTPFENEIGACEDVRYIYSTVITPWEDAGGDITGKDVVSTTGANADVYPVLYFAKDAYALVPLKGKAAAKVTVINPGSMTPSDPLGQRGYIGWKSMQTTVILNQAWMARLEVAAGV